MFRDEKKVGCCGIKGLPIHEWIRVYQVFQNGRRRREVGREREERIND